MKYRNKVCKWKNMNIEYSRDLKEDLTRIENIEGKKVKMLSINEVFKEIDKI